jgi:nickel-dependent lactate racemase
MRARCVARFASTQSVDLAYGQSQFSVAVREVNLLGVYNPLPASAEGDQRSLIAAAMAKPIGKPRLREVVHRGQRVAILTSDLTRPCPSQDLLPFVLEELGSAGVPDEDVFIVMGLGLHRFMTDAEIVKALGPEFSKRFRVLNHDIDDTIRVGVTGRGTPVEIFRPVVDADARICLGVLEYHYFAGYSGGAKGLFPACASRAAVTANHSFMVRPEAVTGRIEGNPVRADLEEAAGMVGVDFILNVVIDEHRVVGAVAGDMITAHRRGCEMIAERGMIPIPRQADIVVASSGGFPKDINMYQAQKALENASYFVRDGGVLILVAECPEGYGEETFKSWMHAASRPQDLLDRIQREFVLGGHKAAAVAAVQARVDVYVVSSWPPEEMRKIGLTPFESPQAALEAALNKLGRDSKVIVLPLAGSTIPKTA